MYLPQPSVEFLGIRIDEPVTTITDLLVSAVYTLYLYTCFHLHGNYPGG